MADDGSRHRVAPFTARRGHAVRARPLGRLHPDTTEGRLSLDNNLAERTLQAVVVGRGNWTFVGSADAGHWAAVHFTGVGTCRHLGIDPFAYLRHVLPRLHELGDRPTDEHLTPFLPDRWLASRPNTSATAA